jgi:hypothetical protein
LDAIEEKNHQLQTKLESYKNDASEDWETFKAGFNADKDGCGASYSISKFSRRNSVSAFFVPKLEKV